MSAEVKLSQAEKAALLADWDILSRRAGLDREKAISIIAANYWMTGRELRKILGISR